MPQVRICLLRTNTVAFETLELFQRRNRQTLIDSCFYATHQTCPNLMHPPYLDLARGIRDGWLQLFACMFVENARSRGHVVRRTLDLLEACTLDDYAVPAQWAVPAIEAICSRVACDRVSACAQGDAARVNPLTTADAIANRWLTYHLELQQRQPNATIEPHDMTYSETIILGRPIAPPTPPQPRVATGYWVIDWGNPLEWCCVSPEGVDHHVRIAGMADRHLWETICWCVRGAIVFYSQVFRPGTGTVRTLDPDGVAAKQWLVATAVFRALVTEAQRRNFTYPVDVYEVLCQYMPRTILESAEIQTPWNDPINNRRLRQNPETPPTVIEIGVAQPAISATPELTHAQTSAIISEMRQSTRTAQDVQRREAARRQQEWRRENSNPSRGTIPAPVRVVVPPQPPLFLDTEGGPRPRPNTRNTEEEPTPPTPAQTPDDQPKPLIVIEEDTVVRRIVLGD